MKLLIVTQKVDIEDSVLGFFHEWINKLALECQFVTVICLEKGRFDLPANVQVFSLGKEKGNFQFSKPTLGSALRLFDVGVFNVKIFKKLIYIIRFYRLIWSLRSEYDTVFVHMNQEYVLLGFELWKLLGKKIYLWRNHAKGGGLTKLACIFSRKVFHTSPEAYVANFRNALIMPVGIDLRKFKPSVRKVEDNKILIFGRVDPVKKIEQIIDGLFELAENKIFFTADIVGSSSIGNEWYQKKLAEKIQDLKLSESIKMLPAVSPEDSPSLYNRYKLFINLTPSGSLDKTIFEALSSGLRAVVANAFFKSSLPKEWVVADPDNPKNLARNIEIVLNENYDNPEISDRVSKFLKGHDLNYLIKTLVLRMNEDI